MVSPFASSGSPGVQVGSPKQGPGRTFATESFLARMSLPQIMPLRDWEIDLDKLEVRHSSQTTTQKMNPHVLDIVTTFCVLCNAIIHSSVYPKQAVGTVLVFLSFVFLCCLEHVSGRHGILHPPHGEPRLKPEVNLEHAQINSYACFEASCTLVQGAQGLCGVHMNRGFNYVYIQWLFHNKHYP